MWLWNQRTIDWFDDWEPNKWTNLYCSKISEYFGLFLFWELFNCQFCKPESLIHQPNVNSDIWSLGLTLIEAAIGRYPVPVPSEDDIHRLLSNDIELIKSKGPSKYFKGWFSITRINTYFFIIELNAFQYLFEVTGKTWILPLRYFSLEFVLFVALSLQLVPQNRTNFDQLLVKNKHKKLNFMS